MARVVVAALLASAGSARASSALIGWQSSTVLASVPQDSRVNVAVDAKGDALAVWTFGAGAAVYVSYRPAGSGGWSKPQIIGTSIYRDRPAVAFDGAGNATVAWVVERGSGLTGLVASTRRAATGKWGQPREVSPAGEGPENFQPALGVDAAGDAVLAWTAAPGFACGCLEEVSYRPAGGNWQPPTKRAGYSFGLAVASDGSMVLAYLDGDAVKAETGFRGVWDAPVVLGHERGNVWPPSVAGAPGGDAAVVWTSADPGFNSIVYGAVRTGGAWQPTQPISFLDRNVFFDPSVGIDARGNVLALFGTVFDLDATLRPAGAAWERPVVVPGFHGSNLWMNAAGQAVDLGVRNVTAFAPLDGLAYEPGIGWGPEQTLDPATGGDAFARAAIDPAGDAIVVWEHHASDNSSDGAIESAILDAGGPVLHAVFDHTRPRISGNARPGGTLRCATGTWTGAPPISFRFRWLRGSKTVGSTQTYRVTHADAGSRLTCRVTATNTLSSLTASSPPRHAQTGD